MKIFKEFNEFYKEGDVFLKVIIIIYFFIMFAIPIDVVQFHSDKGIGTFSFMLDSFLLLCMAAYLQSSYKAYKQKLDKLE